MIDHRQDSLKCGAQRFDNQDNRRTACRQWGARSSCNVLIIKYLITTKIKGIKMGGGFGKPPPSGILLE